MTKLTIREMTTLYDAGNTLAAIAAQCENLGKQGVRYRLKKAGVILRKRGPVPKRPVPGHVAGRTTSRLVRKTASEMITDYHAGLNLRQIGKKHGVSHETVRINLKKRGVSLRDVKGRKVTNITIAIPADHVKMFTKVVTAFGAKRV